MADKKKSSRGIILFISKILGSVCARVIIIAILAVVVVFLVKKAENFGYTVFSVKEADDEDDIEVMVNITPDMTASDVGELLVKKQLLEDASIFRIQAALFTNEKYVLLPGTYMLNSSQSPQEMIQLMTGLKPEEEPESKHLWPEEYDEADDDIELSSGEDAE